MTSAAREGRLGPVDGRFRLHEGGLEVMTGIRERRFWAPGAFPSEGSTRAARLARERSGVGAVDIDYLVHTSVSRDFLEPATASVVHRNLGLSPRAGFCDISNACLGFLNGMVTLANMIELGQIKRGLVVAGESSRQLVETTIDQLLSDPKQTERMTARWWAPLGTGSVAVGLVLARESGWNGGQRVLGGGVLAATQHRELCQGSADTGFGDNAAMSMVTDSELLLNAGCALAGETWAEFRRTLGWSSGDIDRCYTHQVGIAHRDRLYETLQRDPAGDYATLEFLGNVGSVSVPLTMAMGIEKRPPSSGEHIAMLGIGSGLSCMMLGVEW